MTVSERVLQRWQWLKANGLRYDFSFLFCFSIVDSSVINIAYNSSMSMIATSFSAKFVLFSRFSFNLYNNLSHLRQMFGFLECKILGVLFFF